MAMLSLRDAAQLCGRGKSTIQSAIKDGRLSAGRNEQGGYEIDPSELHRVFPFSLSSIGTDEESSRTLPDGSDQSQTIGPAASKSVRKPMSGTGQALSEAEMRIKHLEELLEAERAGRQDFKEALQSRVSDLQGTIADLRKRLDQAEEEKLRLLPPPSTEGQRVAPAPKRRGLWWRLTGR